MKSAIVKCIKYFMSFLFPNNFAYKGKRRGIALTFDDGPHIKNTIDISNILYEKKIKATFFVVGEEAEKCSDTVKFLAQNTHEVANHSYSHKKNSSMQDIKRCEELIKDVTGGSPKLFRPPWGNITPIKLLYTIFNRMKIVLWSFDSLDDKLRTAKELSEYIRKSKISSGDILLFHDDYKHTVEALPDIIDDLKSRGFIFSTVSELLRN